MALSVMMFDILLEFTVGDLQDKQMGLVYGDNVSTCREMKRLSE
jgi:hypothetical protein